MASSRRLGRRERLGADALVDICERKTMASGSRRFGWDLSQRRILHVVDRQTLHYFSVDSRSKV